MSEELKDTAETAEAVEAPVSEAVAVDTSKYTVEDIQKQVKPLSSNGFVRFWQKIWRWWLGTWYGFCDKHPKLSSIIYTVFFFIVFSEGVTIVQILILIFLPQVLGQTLAETPFMIPEVPIKIGDLSYKWSFLGNDLAYDKQGNIIIGGGLGYFIAFKVATFIAQCVNFPLQRNITYRSHGNPWWQAMWYFIGWVLINLACDAINNLWLPIVNYYTAPAVSAILAMVAQGGIAMVIFFFIFLIIFPDDNKKAKGAKAKYEKLLAKYPNATDPKIVAKIVKAENAMKLWEDKATKSNAEKAYFKAKSQVNSSVSKYNAIVKGSQNPKLTAEEKAAYPAKIEKAFEVAVTAIATKEQAEADFNAAKALS